MVHINVFWPEFERASLAAESPYGDDERLLICTDAALANRIQDAPGWAVRAVLREEHVLAVVHNQNRSRWRDIGGHPDIHAVFVELEGVDATAREPDLAQVKFAQRQEERKREGNGRNQAHEQVYPEVAHVFAAALDDDETHRSDPCDQEVKRIDPVHVAGEAILDVIAGVQHRHAVKPPGGGQAREG